MTDRTETIARLKKGVRTASVGETETLAATLAAVLESEATLALHGDLGAGKTSFVRGLANAWGIRGPITSPSFNLLNLYQGQRTLVHIDAYRFQSPDHAESLLLDDFLTPPYCLAVEWPERFPQYRLRDAWVLQLQIIKKGIHEIRLLSAPQPHA